MFLGGSSVLYIALRAEISIGYLTHFLSEEFFCQILIIFEIC